jgi:tetratricopeptide (TPR) repeat protein
VNGPGGRDAAVNRTLQAAIGAIEEGRLDEARRILDANLAARSTNVGLNIRGDILLKQGRPSEALTAFDAAIKLTPRMPEAHCNRGAALQEMGRLEEALAAEDKALRLRPDYATAHFNRGNVLKAMTRMEDAIAAYSRALKARPGFADAMLNRGLARLALGSAPDALADFDHVLAMRPRDATALVGRAGAYRDLGDFARAFAATDAATAIEPDNLEAALIRVNLLDMTEQNANALEVAEAAVVRHGADGRAHAARAIALRKLKRFEEALAAADEAVRLAPRGYEGHEARGIVLSELGRLDEALTALDAAHGFGAAGGSYHHARAVALSGFGDPDEALLEFERALATKPDDASARRNRAFLYLSLGRYEEGWREHEWRMRLPDHGHGDVRNLAPQWQGESFQGKKLLVYAEQGHGDSIQFLRYLPLIIERGGEVTLVVQEPLRRLLEANFPDIEVTATLGMRVGFDWQVSSMSLPFVFGTTLDTVPRAVPYLAGDPALIEKWRRRLGEAGFKIGIAWQGNPSYGRDRFRSIGIGEFAPLAQVAGVRLISLQWAGGGARLEGLPDGMHVETLGEEIDNNPDGFREIAAAMAALDLMVMSDTGPAHLAGALGRPVWLALSRPADWRWMREGSTTPWYPTMRLFRQRISGDWPGVFADMASELRKAIAGG